ncbi:MAG: hypothetical protein GY804_05195 [Alphaproteobacteria bacterium]|nr:hypothetical protein [Alphaproteobacteria bacterium]
MSTSLTFTALRDMDGEFKKMMNIKLFCEENEVSYPEEVSDYFGGLVDQPADCIEDEMMAIKLPHKEITNDYKYGYEINIEDIPDSVKTIQAYLS